MVKAEKRYSQQKHLWHGGHGFPKAEHIVQEYSPQGPQERITTWFLSFSALA